MVFPQVRDDAERWEAANIRELVIAINDFPIMNVSQEYCYSLRPSPVSCVWSLLSQLCFEPTECSKCLLRVL